MITNKQTNKRTKEIIMKRKQQDDDELGSSSKKQKHISKLRSHLTLPDTCTSDEAYEQFFDTCANYLLNEAVLYVNNEFKCRIAEVEFYVYEEKSSDSLYAHTDPFCHKYFIELTPCQWYFMRAGNADTSDYKGGSYKGFNVTFGKEGVYAGALVRSIVTPDKGFIEGPSKTVDYILNHCSVSSIKELVDNKFNGELDLEKNENVVCFKDRSYFDDSDLELNQLFNTGKENIIQCARVGLTLKKLKSIKNRTIQEQYLDYLIRPYRYCLYPHENKKFKLALVCALFIKYSDQELIIDKIAQELNVSNKCVQSYYKSYLVGVNKKKNLTDDSEKGFSYLKKRFFGKSLSISENCELYGYLSTHA